LRYMKDKAFHLTRLQTRSLLRLLVDPLGRSARSLELVGANLCVNQRGRSVEIPLQDVVAPPTVQNGMLGASLRIASGGNAEVYLMGANKAKADAFAAAVLEAWTKSNHDILDPQESRLESVLLRISRLQAPTRYPAACAVTPLLEQARALSIALSKVRPEAVGKEAAERIARVDQFCSNPRAARAAAIEAFVSTELAQWSEFFDTIESKPLTPEQRLSVVVDEDATLVLAGAGSGKTSVITAKAAYLVKSGIQKPEEILLLAFAKNAALEMSERVEARSGVPISAQTFHALAYDIIGKVEGSKPALADHASDDLAYTNLLRDILRHLVRTRSDVAVKIIRWFAHFLVEPKTEWDFQTKHEFYIHLEQQDLRTLQGEKVKSYEELQIANWLYENGIAYEYEPLYEHKVSDGGRRDYQPDFRLTESGIYIEHFGVRLQKLANGSERLVTAPFVEREAYLQGMEWKRQVHVKHGTILIETFSYERQEGRLFTSLAEKLAKHVELRPRPPEEIYDRIIEMHQVDDFTKVLGTFLRKYKSGAYRVADCLAKAEALKLGSRANAFLEVFEPVYEEYQAQLKDRIDFEDMILRAGQYVEARKYVSPYRHILVDEFQDISQSRARLVKALKAQHSDARLFGVGDDWQSIFRFAGSDIHLMRRFGEEFGGSFDGEKSVHRTVDLGRTFRSVDQIAFVARTFVLRNPDQIPKRIVPAGAALEPAIKLLAVAKGEDQARLADVLLSLARRPREVGRPASVLLLGRYNFLRPDMALLKRQFAGLEITFKTIHASKGLEADHVVLLNADSGRMGFPSEIVDDRLLALVSPEEEVFPNAEERRVMYVAMTRARHTLTILSANARPSAFVTELRDDPAYGLEGSPEDRTQDHRCGECGGRLLAVTGQDRRVWYRCEHARHCVNLLPACQACGSQLPRKDLTKTEVICSCGATYHSCPSCADGWLVDRAGRYGAFLGCVRYPACSGRARTAPRDIARRN
jgi:DNA helicase IV